MLLNRTHKIAAVYKQICPRPRILPPFFIHNFLCQLGRGHSLFIYFYAEIVNLIDIETLRWPSRGENGLVLLLPELSVCLSV